MRPCYLVGAGWTRLGRLGKTSTDLMRNALELSLSDSKAILDDVDGLIAVPSLSDPKFMQVRGICV